MSATDTFQRIRNETYVLVFFLSGEHKSHQKSSFLWPALFKVIRLQYHVLYRHAEKVYKHLLVLGSLILEIFSISLPHSSQKCHGHP